MTSKHIIFDFDGTIADTFTFALDIANRLADEFGFKPVNKEDYEYLRGQNPTEIFKYLHVPILKLPQIIMQAQKELHKEIDKVYPINGLQEVLENLQKMGHRMSILTSNSASNVKRFLKNNNMEWFDSISTSSKLWGKTKHLKKVLNDQNLDPQNVFYVGDEIRDIVQSHEAGLKAIAVTWGFNSEKALAEHNPDFIIDSPEELLSKCGLV